VKGIIWLATTPGKKRKELQLVFAIKEGQTVYHMSWWYTIVDSMI